MTGTFGLVVTATTGEHAGHSASGTLTLTANREERLRMADAAGGFVDRVAVPYYGVTDVDFATVGALRLGGGNSEDPMQPGVLVIRSNSIGGEPESLVMRVGKDANVRDVSRFDGGYTVLRVQAVTEDAILGEWASGMLTETAAGYFCAVRR